MDTFTDRELTCVACEQGFTFTAEDQEYHGRMGFTNEPKRCKPCRAARKRDTEGSGGGGGSRGPAREMHEAVCADCGQTARVPFKPRGDRPVYCSDCFSKHR